MRERLNTGAAVFPQADSPKEFMKKSSSNLRVPKPRRATKKELASWRELASIVIEGDDTKFFDAFLAHIRRYNRVDEVLPEIPGYAAGMHIIDGRRVLVQRDSPAGIN